MGKLTLFLLGICAMTAVLAGMQILDPRGAFAGLLLGGCGGLALFITGPFWLVKKFMASAHAEVVAEVDPVVAKALSEKTDAEIVDFIDAAINRLLVVASHPWLAQHWHKLGAGEKTKWVHERREFLNTSLGAVKAPIHFVTALQQADKEFCRKESTDRLTK